jgi:hypothetical protein
LKDWSIPDEPQAIDVKGRLAYDATQGDALIQVSGIRLQRPINERVRVSMSSKRMNQPGR